MIHLLAEIFGTRSRTIKRLEEENRLWREENEALRDTIDSLIADHKEELEELEAWYENDLKNYQSGRL